MQKIIDFRAMEALKTSSEMSTEISRLAQKNAEKSRKDARTITIITIFTLIFLPASFVSVRSAGPNRSIYWWLTGLVWQQFLSMGYIDLGPSHNPASLHFHSEMWIFGIMTLLLLLVTLGSWLWLEVRARRRRPDQPVDCEAGGNV